MATTVAAVAGTGVAVGTAADTVSGTAAVLGVQRTAGAAPAAGAAPVVGAVAHASPDVAANGVVAASEVVVASGVVVANRIADVSRAADASQHVVAARVAMPTAANIAEKNSDAIAIVMRPFARAQVVTMVVARTIVAITGGPDMATVVATAVNQLANAIRAATHATILAAAASAV